MNEVIIYKMVNGEWKYITKTRFYNNAKEICEAINDEGYDAKITELNGTAIKYYLLDE